jgi:acyl-CoA thioesterase FadM
VTDAPTEPADYDTNDHVSNLGIARLLDVARSAWIHDLAGREGPCFVRHLEISYESEARPGEQLRCGVRIDTVGRSSFRVSQALVEAESGRLVATADVVHVCFDLATRQVVECWPAMLAEVERLQGRPVPRT